MCLIKFWAPLLHSLARDLPDIAFKFAVSSVSSNVTFFPPFLKVRLSFWKSNKIGLYCLIQSVPNTMSHPPKRQHSNLIFKHYSLDPPPKAKTFGIIQQFVTISYCYNHRLGWLYHYPIHTSSSWINEAIGTPTINQYSNNMPIDFALNSNSMMGGIT